MRAHVRFLVLTSLLLIPGCSRDDAAGDEERLQGSWQLLSGVINGKNGRTELYIGTVTFKDDQFDVQCKSLEMRATIHVDETTDPKEIDFVDRAGVPSYGIYAVERNRMKICWAPANAARPTEFASKPGTNQVSLVLMRQKVELNTTSKDRQ